MSSCSAFRPVTNLMMVCLRYIPFEPDENRRSLGAFAIMKQIEYAQQQQLDYVYLGYWVPHSNKMNYKSQYTPLELLLDGQWRRINRSLSAEEIQLWETH